MIKKKLNQVANLPSVSPESHLHSRKQGLKKKLEHDILVNDSKQLRALTLRLRFVHFQNFKLISYLKFYLYLK